MLPQWLCLCAFRGRTGLNCAQSPHCQLCYIFFSFWQPQLPVKISGPFPVTTPFRNTQHIPVLSNVLMYFKRETVRMDRQCKILFILILLKHMQVQNTAYPQAYNCQTITKINLQIGCKINYKTNAIETSYTSQEEGEGAFLKPHGSTQCGRPMSLIILFLGAQHCQKIHAWWGLDPPTSFSI